MLTVPDLRCPGEPMANINIKVPPDLIVKLQDHADRIGISRAQLARTLLVQELQKELESTGNLP